MGAVVQQGLESGRARAARRQRVRGMAAGWLVAVLAAAGLAAGAVAQAQDKPGVKPGGTLIIGQYQEPTVYDPNRQYSWETYRVDKHIYESLVAEDLGRPAKDGPPPLVPALAERWEVSADARTFTFFLRRNVKFHDGTDFDAEAVRFNVRRFTDTAFEFYDARAAATMKPVYGKLEALKVIDRYTVQYVFTAPFIDFPRLLPQGNYVSGIFSPAALKKHGQDGLALNPTGTGPYKFVERVHGEKTVLVRNDDWWGGKAPLDRIIFRPIPDDATRLSALRSGEIDILTRVPADAADALEKARYTVHDSTTAGQLFLSWNFRNEFVKHRAVREAIAAAIDRDGLAKTIFKGRALASRNILNIGSTAYDPAQQDVAYNPDRARALLKEAGFKEGEVRFTIITDVANQPAVEWIQRDLGKVGIRVDVVSQEWLTYTSKLANLAPETGLFTMEWGFVTPYWLKLAYDAYVVTRGGGEKVVDPELGPAIAKAASQTDETQAIAAWKAANAVAQRDVAFLPLVTFRNHFASAPNVQGFNVPAQNFYDLTKVWLKP
ncbi:MAG: ABC transporter substrate-binding protein [Achromobacter sp.]|uniref:ABC transporter substrate-binding protein n=1 Tax=Achromobacter sp. TaxID=134375 RepID=UPI003D0804C5